jgi:hypothetical protein
MARWRVDIIGKRAERELSLMVMWSNTWTVAIFRTAFGSR